MIYVYKITNKFINQIYTHIQEKKSYCPHSKKYHKSITLEWLELCQRVIAQCTKNEKIVQQ